VELGRCAVPQLIRCLNDLDYRTRWEAAKVLLELEDATAAPALVEALGDPVQEVRWLASEALIALNEQALPPLMQWMAQHDDSKWLRESAYHVLYSLERKRHLREESLAVLNALRDIAPQETVSVVAHRAFVSLTEHHHTHHG
jgi:HEAT repeat protein